MRVRSRWRSSRSPGLGVLAASWLPGQLGASPVGLLVAAGFAGLVGAVIAIPCLRLRDLYLALGTMAFALVVEQNVLGQIPGFATDSKAFARWSPIASDKAYFVAIAVVFVVLAWFVIALRRGEFGRRLQAMKDSPAACTTVGLDLTRTKVQVFALAAAIAGIGGFLLAGWKGTVGKDDFSLLTGTLSALPVLLLAVVGGITVVSGAMIGALLLVAMPADRRRLPVAQKLDDPACPASSASRLARNPDGLASDLRNAIRDARARFIARGRAVRPADCVAPPPRSDPRARRPARSRHRSRSGARSNASWASPRRTAVALFEARGLTVRFGGHNAVNEVDLDVERGCVTGLIGPNGAGKTTIFNAITGLQEVSGGTLTLDGRDITHETPTDTGAPRHGAHVPAARGVRKPQHPREHPRRGRDPAPVGARPRFEPAPTTPRRSSIVSACAPWPTSGPTRFRPAWPGSASWVAPSPTRPRLLLLDEPASGLSDGETETLRRAVALAHRRGDGGVARRARRRARDGCVRLGPRHRLRRAGRGGHAGRDPAQPSGARRVPGSTDRRRRTQMPARTRPRDRRPESQPLRGGERERHPCSSSATSPRPTERSRCCTASTWSCRGAMSSRCSDRTARGRARRSRSRAAR